MKSYIHRLVVSLFDQISLLYQKFLAIELSKYSSNILDDEIKEEFTTDLSEIQELLECVEHKVLDTFNYVTSK